MDKKLEYIHLVYAGPDVLAWKLVADACADGSFITLMDELDKCPEEVVLAIERMIKKEGV